MPRWLSDLLTNPALTTLTGVVMGAAITWIAALSLNRKQRRDTHRAAVRAVLYELNEISVQFDAGTGYGLASTAMYDALAVPLYTDLPDEVAWHVAEAYAFVHMMGPKPANLKKARAQIEPARDALLTYARQTLKLKFVPPEQSAASRPSDS